jgi:hypothetical protein
VWKPHHCVAIESGVPPKRHKKDPAAVAMGLKRSKKLSAAQRKEVAAKGGAAAWANLTPEERSVEMKRRAVKRKRNKAKRKRPKP